MSDLDRKLRSSTRAEKENLVSSAAVTTRSVVIPIISPGPIMTTATTPLIYTPGHAMGKGPTSTPVSVFSSGGAMSARRASVVFERDEFGVDGMGGVSGGASWMQGLSGKGGEDKNLLDDSKMDEEIFEARLRQRMSAKPMDVSRVARLQAAWEQEKKKMQRKFEGHEWEAERELRIQLERERMEEERRVREQREKREEEERKAERKLRVQLERERMEEERKARERREKREDEERKAERELRIQLERERMEEERRMREEERKAEREMRMQLERERMGADAKKGDENMKIFRLKARIPQYDDKTDIDQYLLQFEQVAVSQGWPQDRWAEALLPMLTGVARDAVLSVQPENRKDWRGVKDAILFRKQRNADYYHREFRTARKADGETYQVFAARLEQMALKWLEASKRDREDPDSIWNLFLLERLYDTLKPNLLAVVRKAKSADIHAAAEVLQDHVQAYALTPSYNIGRYSQTKPDQKDVETNEQGRFPKGQNSGGRGRGSLRNGVQDKPSVSSQGPNSGPSVTHMRCERCWSPHHLKDTCPKLRLSVMADVPEAKHNVVTPPSLCDTCAERPYVVHVNASVNGKQTIAL